MNITGTTVDLLRDRGDALSLDAAEKIMNLRAEVEQVRRGEQVDDSRCDAVIVRYRCHLKAGHDGGHKTTNPETGLKVTWDSRDYK